MISYLIHELFRNFKKCFQRYRIFGFVFQKYFCYWFLTHLHCGQAIWSHLSKFFWNFLTFFPGFVCSDSYKFFICSCNECVLSSCWMQSFYDNYIKAVIYFVWKFYILDDFFACLINQLLREFCFFKSPTMFVDSSIFPCSFVNFCFRYFEVVLVGHTS